MKEVVGSNVEEVAEGWRKFRNVEFHDLSLGITGFLDFVHHPVF
jgi:hypothetical protein